MVSIVSAIAAIACAFYTWRTAHEQRKTRMDDRFPYMIVRARDMRPVTDNSYVRTTETRQLRLVNVGRGPAFIKKFPTRNVPGYADKDHIDEIDRVLGPEIGDPDLQCHFAYGVSSDLRKEDLSIGIEYEDTGGRIFRSGIIKGKPVWDPPPEFRLSWFAIQRQKIYGKEEVSELVKELRAFLAE